MPELDLNTSFDDLVRQHRAQPSVAPSPSPAPLPALPPLSHELFATAWPTSGTSSTRPSFNPQKASAATLKGEKGQDTATANTDLTESDTSASLASPGPLAASSFLLTRRNIPLEELARDLVSYLHTLRAELVDVINAEYTAFIGLAVELRNAQLRERAAHVAAPLVQIERRVGVTRATLQGMRSTLEATLETRKQVRAEKAALQALVEVDEQVTKVALLIEGEPRAERGDSSESWASDSVSAENWGGETLSAESWANAIGSTDPSTSSVRGPRGAHTHSHTLTRTIDTLSLPPAVTTASPASPSHLLRTAGEYNHMLYLLDRQPETPFTTALRARATTLRDALVKKLDGALGSALAEGVAEGVRGGGVRADGMQALARTGSTDDFPAAMLFRAYATLAAEETARDIVRRSVFRPAVQKLIYSNVLGSPQSPVIPSVGGEPYAMETIRVPVFDSADTSPAETAQIDALALLYNKILSYVARNWAALLRVRGFQLVTVLFDELANRIMSRLGFVIFASGRPAVFHRNYTLSMAFLSRIESICASIEDVEHLRASSAYHTFVRRFQLPVYFQLRYKEVVSAVERSLTDSVATKARSEGQFLTTQTQALFFSLVTIWDDRVFLDELAGKFWKLSLQLLSRYRAWLVHVVPAVAEGPEGASASAVGAASAAGGSGTPGTPGTPGTQTPQGTQDMSLLPMLAVLIHDITLLEAKARETLKTVIFAKLADALGEGEVTSEASHQGEHQGENGDSAEKVDSAENTETSENADSPTPVKTAPPEQRTPPTPVLRRALQTTLTGAFEEGLENITSLIPRMSALIVAVLTARAAEQLKLVRSVASQVRASGARREAPEPSYFVAAILRDVHAFVDGPAAGISAEMKTAWATAVLEEIARRYATILSAQKKTEESLRWLKKGRQGLSFFSRASTPAPEEPFDAVKVQMIADIESLGRDAESLGVDVAACEPFAALRAAVESD